MRRRIWDPTRHHLIQPSPPPPNLLEILFDQPDKLNSGLNCLSLEPNTRTLNSSTSWFNLHQMRNAFIFIVVLKLATFHESIDKVFQSSWGSWCPIEMMTSNVKFEIQDLHWYKNHSDRTTTTRDKHDWEEDSFYVGCIAPGQLIRNPTLSKTKSVKFKRNLTSSAYTLHSTLFMLSTWMIYDFTLMRIKGAIKNGPRITKQTKYC